MVKTLLRNPWKRGGYAALRQVIYGFLSASEAKKFLEELVKKYPSRHAMREEFVCRRSERTRIRLMIRNGRAAGFELAPLAF